MTDKSRREVIDVKALLAGNDAFIRTVVRAALQEVLEAEMTEAVGAGKGERTASRLGYRSGYEARDLDRGPLGLATGQARAPDADHAGRQARAQGAAGSGRPVLDRVI